MLAFTVLVIFSHELPGATVAHWTFDSSGTWLQDSSGNAHHLTNGNPTGASYSNGAASFSGGGVGIVSTPNNAAWTDSSFTIEAIITADAVDSLRSIAGHFSSDVGRQWLFLTDAGKLSIILNNGTTETSFAATALTLEANRQYYVAAAIDLTAATPADRIKFYLQDLTAGSALQTVNVSTAFTSFISSTAPFSIGSTGHSSSRFDGLIHEVRFSNTALGSDALLVPEPRMSSLLMLGLLTATLRRKRSKTGGG